KEVKQNMFTSQDGKCILCGRELDKDVMKNHLDHDHALTGPNAGRVRGLLCCLCNGTEGIVKHKFNRSGLAGRGVDYIMWLENLVTYLKKDYGANDYHPQYIPDTIKQFGRQSLGDMRIEMESRGYSFEPSDTKSELVKKFGKQFRKEQKDL
ncbi:MAG: endonuclease domain-containing protein, partial [Cetobacterium sp.]|uniref:endonuclease domain-containing protein n=1 Tax=Cetobacterium sp. TaxID=2071632 RepID=UPI003EE7C011